MGTKIGFVGGATVGLLVGSRIGPKLYERVAAGATSLAQNPSVRRGIGNAGEKAAGAAKTAGNTAAEKARETVSAASHRISERRHTDGHGGGSDTEDGSGGTRSEDHTAGGPTSGRTAGQNGHGLGGAAARLKRSAGHAVPMRHGHGRDGHGDHGAQDAEGGHDAGSGRESRHESGHGAGHGLGRHAEHGRDPEHGRPGFRHRGRHDGRMSTEPVNGTSGGLSSGFEGAWESKGTARSAGTAESAAGTAGSKPSRTSGPGKSSGGSVGSGRAGGGSGGSGASDVPGGASGGIAAGAVGGAPGGVTAGASGGADERSAGHDEPNPWTEQAAAAKAAARAARPTSTADRCKDPGTLPKHDGTSAGGDEVR